MKATSGSSFINRSNRPASISFMYRGSHGISLFSTQFLSYRDRISPNRSACHAPGAEGGTGVADFGFATGHNDGAPKWCSPWLTRQAGNDRRRWCAPLGPMRVEVVIVPTPKPADAVKQIDAEPLPVLAKPAPAPVPAPMPAASARVMLGEAHPVERRPPPSLRGCGIESVRHQGFSQGDQILPKDTMSTP